MKIKNKIKLLGLTLSSGALSLLIGMFAQGVAHAAVLDCTWTGGTDNQWSTAANWSGCNNAAPVAGSNIIFDNTSIPTTGNTSIDDLNVSFNNLTFQGSGTQYGYIITNSGNPTYVLTLTGSITQSDAVGDLIDMPVSLGTTAAASVSVSKNIEFGDISNTAFTLNIGTYGAQFFGTGSVDNYEAITSGGMGAMTINLTGTGSNQIFTQYVPSPNDNAGVMISSGALYEYPSSTAATMPDFFPNTAGGIVIQSGASLVLHDISATTATIAEHIEAAGTGVGLCHWTGALSGSINCGAIYAELASGSNLNITGQVIMSGAAQFNSNDTITVSGALSGNYKLENIAGTLIVTNSTDTQTPNGTYTATGNGVNGGGTGGTTGAGGTVAPPKTPNTGSQLYSSKVLFPVSALMFLASSMYLLSAKFKKSTVKNRR